MDNLKSTSLIDITAKQMQFCNGLKALIDGGCNLDALGGVLDELCDLTELIDQKVNLEFSNR